MNIQQTHMNMAIELPLDGREFKQVRELLNYTARDVAEHLERRGMKPATVRGIYAMEDYRAVRSALIPHLSALFGAKQFERAVALVRAKRRKQFEEAAANRQRWEIERAQRLEQEKKAIEERQAQSERILDRLERGLEVR